MKIAEELPQEYIGKQTAIDLLCRIRDYDISVEDAIRLVNEMASSIGTDYVVTSMSIFDEEEIYGNCTVQVWRNSVTGEKSVGWWSNE